jgi:hypothetical protein
MNSPIIYVFIVPALSVFLAVKAFIDSSWDLLIVSGIACFFSITTHHLYRDCRKLVEAYNKKGEEAEKKIAEITEEAGELWAKILYVKTQFNTLVEVHDNERKYYKECLKKQNEELLNASKESEERFQKALNEILEEYK